MAQYDINLREYWRILKKRKLVILLITLLLGLFSTSFAILKKPDPLYTTVCLIEIQKSPVIEGMYTNNSNWSEADNIATQMSVIKSYAVFQRVAEKMGLIPKQDLQGDRQLKSSTVLIIEDLQSKIDITREKYSSILQIKAKDSSPAFAQKLANTIALTYGDLHAEQQMQRNTEALKYIDGQQKDVREKLHEAEDEFNRFSKENELISIDLQSEKLLSRTQEIQNEIRKSSQQKAELSDIAHRLNRFISDPSISERDFYSAKAEARYQALHETFVSLVLRRDTLLKEYTPKHPEVAAIRDEILENARKMALTLQQQVRNLEKAEIEIAEEARAIENKTKGLLDKKLEYNRLKRKVELYTEMIALLERKNQEAMIRRAEKPETVNIVKPALLPTKAINTPSTAVNGIMGVVIGMVLGLVVAFIVETFDTSLGAIEDVEQTLGTQVLGVIPQTDVKDVHAGLTEKLHGKPSAHSLKQAVNLISHFAPDSIMAESFRALGTNIEFKDMEKRLKTIVITSSSPQEGKTLVAANLALNMAQAGKKTLLVGSDLRKPSIGKLFGIESTPGLTEVLLGNCNWHDTVRTVVDLVLGEVTFEEVILAPGLDNLHLITSGSVPRNPATLVDSIRFTEFINEAKKEYDLLIFDTPPILSATDAVIIGTKVDGVLLVYRIGAVSRLLLRRAANQLEQVKGHVLGVILNGMRPDLSPDFEDYKHYKYYYSYGEEEKQKRHRKKNSLLPWLEMRRESPEPPEDGQNPGKGERAPAEKRKWSSILRIGLILAAGGLLIGALLYQNEAVGPPGYLEAKGHINKVEQKPLRSEKSVDTNPSERQPVQKKESPATVSKVEYQVDEKPVTLSSRSDPSVTTMTVPSSTPAATGKANAEKPVSLKDSSIHPYSLYLGSVPNPELAKRGVMQSRKKGISAYAVKLELSNGVWYRIYAGAFAEQNEGEKLIREKKLRDAKVVKTPWANLIGVYSSSGEVESRAKHLRDLDYFPYVVKCRDGTKRLYVGAFYDKERAEGLYEELKARDIDTQTVQR
jgi:polysaccharide biosynthesis transport protein